MNREYIYLKDLIKDKLRDDYEVQIILGKDKKGEVAIKELDNILFSGHRITHVCLGKGQVFYYLPLH